MPCSRASAPTNSTKASSSSSSSLFACVLLMPDRLAAAEHDRRTLPAALRTPHENLAAEDVILDVVAEVRHFAGRARRAPAQRQVEPKRSLGRETRVADLEREVSVVHAEEEQLLERRRARRERNARRHREAIVGRCGPQQNAA